MWMHKGYFVYIMSSQRRVLYVGITNNLPLRVWQHKTGAVEGFTSKYKVTQLVYYESFDNVHNAIHREKEIKGWLRQKKIELIEGVNPKPCEPQGHRLDPSLALGRDAPSRGSG